MLTYFVIELQTNADGTCGNIVWNYAQRELAEAKYHEVLSAAAVSSLACHAAVILRADGTQMAAQAYEHGVS